MDRVDSVGGVDRVDSAGFTPRIGLSATLSDLDLAAAFLRPGGDPDAVLKIESRSDRQDIQAQIRGYKNPPAIAPAELPVSPPAASSDEDSGEDDSGEESDDEPVKEAIAAHLYRTLRAGHHLVFANARQTVEDFTDRLGRMCAQEAVACPFVPHHGSLSREIREDAEARLKGDAWQGRWAWLRKALRHPKTIVQAQFSIPYTVACALIDGEVSLRHFTDEALARPEILAVAAKVDCVVDEGIERDWSRSISPTALVVQAGNVAFKQRVDYPKGHPKAPMSQADLDAKLRDCLAFSGLDWPEDTAARLRDLVAGVEQLGSARDVIRVMVPPRRY